MSGMFPFLNFVGQKKLPFSSVIVVSGIQNNCSFSVSHLVHKRNSQKEPMNGSFFQITFLSELYYLIYWDSASFHSFIYSLKLYGGSWFLFWFFFSLQGQPSVDWLFGMKTDYRVPLSLSARKSLPVLLINDHFKKNNNSVEPIQVHSV